MVKKLKTYWWNKEIDKATNLFIINTFLSRNTVYKLYTTFSEIVEEWQHIKEQNIRNTEFKILAIDNNILTVAWIFE